jgi:hypothetical protein
MLYISRAGVGEYGASCLRTPARAVSSPENRRDRAHRLAFSGRTRLPRNARAAVPHIGAPAHAHSDRRRSRFRCRRRPFFRDSNRLGSPAGLGAGYGCGRGGGGASLSRIARSIRSIASFAVLLTYGSTMSKE